MPPASAAPQSPVPRGAQQQRCRQPPAARPAGAAIDIAPPLPGGGDGAVGGGAAACADAARHSHLPARHPRPPLPRLRRHRQDNMWVGGWGEQGGEEPASISRLHASCTTHTGPLPSLTANWRCSCMCMLCRRRLSRQGAAELSGGGHAAAGRQAAVVRGHWQRWRRGRLRCNGWRPAPCCQV